MNRRTDEQKKPGIEVGAPPKKIKALYFVERLKVEKMKGLYFFALSLFYGDSVFFCAFFMAKTFKNENLKNLIEYVSRPLKLCTE